MPFRSQRLPAILHPYLLGLTPSGSSFRRAVAAPLAFLVRCEDNIYVCEFYVNKNFIYVYIESKNTADTMKASAVTPGREQKSPSRGGAGGAGYAYFIRNYIVVSDFSIMGFTCSVECPNQNVRRGESKDTIIANILKHVLKLYFLFSFVSSIEDSIVSIFIFIFSISLYLFLSLSRSFVISISLVSSFAIFSINSLLRSSLASRIAILSLCLIISS